MKVYLNGEWLSDKKATVSLFDHGFLYGDGVYETIRVYGGRPFLLHEHLRRLNQSLNGIRLAPPSSLIELGRVVQKAITMNRQREAVVRIIISRGPGPFGFDIRPCRTPTVAVIASPFQAYPDAMRRRGVTLAVVSIRRNAPDALPPWIKSTSCLNSILAKTEATDSGADEGLMLTRSNFVAEGTVSNVFLVQRGRVVTPRLEGTVLPGVTREWVCRLAGEAGFRVDEDAVPASALASADEIFLTNSTMEIMPVARVVWPLGDGGRTLEVGGRLGGKPGPVTRKLSALFRRAVARLIRA